MLSFLILMRQQRRASQAGAMAAMVARLGRAVFVAKPSSITHVPGRSAVCVVAAARVQIAGEFGCQADEPVFSSGATEAKSLALRGVALAHADHGHRS
jgi:cysteine desulfurase